MHPHESNAISTTQATAVSILLTVLYVGVLYLSPHTRPRKPHIPLDYHWSQDPIYIRLRIRAASWATAVSVVVTVCILGMSIDNDYGWVFVFRNMGLWPLPMWGGWEAIETSLRVVGLVGWLFIGSLFDKFVVGEGGAWSWRLELKRDWWRVRHSWVGYKTLIVV